MTVPYTPLNGVVDERRPLTARQQAILDFIKGYMEKYRSAPTFREVADGFGIYVNAVTDHLAALERKGWIDIRRRHGTEGHAGSMSRAIIVL